MEKVQHVQSSTPSAGVCVRLCAPSQLSRPTRMLRFTQCKGKTVLMHCHAQLRLMVVLCHGAFVLEHTDQPCAFMLEHADQTLSLLVTISFNSSTPTVFIPLSSIQVERILDRVLSPLHLLLAHVNWCNLAVSLQRTPLS